LVGSAVHYRISFYLIILSVLQMLVIADVVPNSLIISTLITETTLSSETSVLRTATRRRVPTDVIPHSHRRENLRSYIAFTG
jgi:hypothetical protein